MDSQLTENSNEISKLENELQFLNQVEIQAQQSQFDLQRIKDDIMTQRKNSEKEIENLIQSINLTNSKISDLLLISDSLEYCKENPNLFERIRNLKLSKK